MKLNSKPWATQSTVQNTPKAQEITKLSISRSEDKIEIKRKNIG